MQAGEGKHKERMAAVCASGSSSVAVALIQATDARAQQHGNETEHLYSFMQVMTACTGTPSSCGRGGRFADATSFFVRTFGLHGAIC